MAVNTEILKSINVNSQGKYVKRLPCLYFFGLTYSRRLAGGVENLHAYFKNNIMPDLVGGDERGAGVCRGYRRRGVALSR